jgi:hypothetical protein
MEREAREKIISLLKARGSVMSTEEKPPAPEPAKPKLNGGRPPGPQFKTTAPSIIVAVQEAMECSPKHQEDAAKLIDMHKESYSFIRKLIIIGQDPLLPKEDREKLDGVFTAIEKDRSLAHVRVPGRDLINRHWQKKKEPSYVVNHRRRRFDQTIVAIREGCESTSEMTLPRDLKREDISDAISSLSMSIELISKLVRRLTGGSSEAQ